MDLFFLPPFAWAIFCFSRRLCSGDPPKRRYILVLFRQIHDSKVVNPPRRQLLYFPEKGLKLTEHLDASNPDIYI